MVNIVTLILTVGILCAATPILSLPITIIRNHDSVVATTESPSTTSARPLSNRLSLDDYVVSDTQYQQLLDRLSEQATDSVAENPANYVSNDATIEDILRLIEQSNNSTPTTTTSSNEESSSTSTGSSGHINVEETTTTSTAQTIEGIYNLEGVYNQNQDIPEERDFASIPPLSYVTSSTPSTTTIITRTAPTTEHEEECSICLEPFVYPGSATTFLCGHKFHSNCIHSWASEQIYDRQQPRCPMCRKVLHLQDGQPLVPR